MLIPLPNEFQKRTACDPKKREFIPPAFRHYHFAVKISE